MHLQLVAPLKPAPLDPEDQILIDEEHAAITPEEMADGWAQFEALFPNDLKPRS